MSKRIDDFVAAVVKGTQRQTLWAERCELLEACEALLDVLPDSYDWLWDELSDDAQETVKRARKLADTAIAKARGRL